MRWLDSTINAMDMNLGKLQEMVRARPGVPQSRMGLRRVGHDWATEQQRGFLNLITTDNLAW